MKMPCSLVDDGLRVPRAPHDPHEPRSRRCNLLEFYAERSPSKRSFIRRGLSDLIFPRRGVRGICPTHMRYFAAAGSAVLSPDRFRELLGLSREPEPILREILTRNEFKETLSESVFEHMVDHVLDLVQKALSWVYAHRPKIDFGFLDGRFDLLWQALGVFLFSLIVVLLVGACALLVYRVLLPYARARATEVAKDGTQSLGESSDVTRLREEALNLARQGRYGEAVVRLFRFVLVQLDRRGRLLLHPAKTNREILRSLPPQEPIREALAEMISQFDSVRYGGFPCSKPEFDRFLGLSDHLTEGR